MPTVYHWNINGGSVKNSEKGPPECIGNELVVVQTLHRKKMFMPGQKVTIGPLSTVYHISLEPLLSTFNVNIALESGEEKEFNIDIKIGVDADLVVKACQRLVKETPENIRDNVKSRFIESIEKLIKEETDLSHLINNENGIIDEVNLYLNLLGLALVEFKFRLSDEKLMKSEVYQVEKMLVDLREEAKQQLTKIVVTHKEKIQELQLEEQMIHAKMKQLSYSIQSKLRQLEPTIEEEASAILNAQEDADLILSDAEEEADEILSTARDKVDRLRKFAERFDDSYLVVVKLDALQSAVDGVKGVLQAGVNTIKADERPPDSFKYVMTAIEATPPMME